MRRRAWQACIVLVCVFTAAKGDTPSAPFFSGIGDFPGGPFSSAALAVSGDGSTLVGIAGLGSGYQAFRWQPGAGMTALPDLPGGQTYCAAQGISSDGSVIVGYGSTAANGQPTSPVRWVNGGAAQTIGVDPNLPGQAGSASGVSANGDVIAGAYANRGFVWNLGAVQQLDPVSFLGTCSADGSAVGGHRVIGNYYEPIIWRLHQGIQALPTVPNATTSNVEALSADGQIAAGTSGGSAIRWSDGGMQILPLLPNAFTAGAGAISADGSIVVGHSNPFGTLAACIWTDDGAQNVKSVLQGFGLNMTGWTLSDATGISFDGRVIVGVGTNPFGQSEGWYAVIPEPSSGLLAVVAALLTIAFRTSRPSFAAPPAP